MISFNSEFDWVFDSSNGTWTYEDDFFTTTLGLRFDGTFWFRVLTRHRLVGEDEGLGSFEEVMEAAGDVMTAALEVWLAS